MIKGIAFLLLILLAPNLFADTISANEVRLLYSNAAEDKNACNRLIQLLSENESSLKPVYKGYKGCAMMMKAKYLFNPWSKYSSFASGKELLENAISLDKENIELRYLRFTIQTNSPFFLGYRHHIDEDKVFLLKAVMNISDHDLRRSAVSYLKNSAYLTEAERQNLL